MSEQAERPISITGMQAVEWGPQRTQMMQDIIKTVMEEKLGRPLQWRPECNRDAITLGDADTPRPEPAAFARVDFYDGHVLVQHLGGTRERLTLEVLSLGRRLLQDRPQSSVTTSEVEAVKA